jgi:hypothetical protein
MAPKKPRVEIQRVPDFEPRQHAPSPDYSSEPAGPEDFGGTDEGSHYDRVPAEDLRATHAAAVARAEAENRGLYMTPGLDPAFVAFVDSVAVGLFVSGWPKATIYSHAETLWSLRTKWLESKGL